MIRLATPNDASQAMDLVLIVLKDMELSIFNQLPEETIKNLLVKGFIEKPNYRYGFNNAIVKEIENEIVGVAFGYPGYAEKEIDNDFLELLIENNLSKDYLFFDAEEIESLENEWYLDTLVTSPLFRGQGVAKELLNSLPEIAKKHQCSLLGLNVDKINHLAKKLYLDFGYEEVGELSISNHLYDHLQKSVFK